MTLDEYEKSERERYQRLSEAVSSIIAVSLENAGLKYQQLQHRAKDVPSLKQKLKDRGIIEQADICTAVKDLAGCRILFYTNSDVADFLHSQIIWENFEVDRERTKFHYPLEQGDADQLFISYNYVVRLKEPRLSLSEYANFKDMWCEVQVQTTLDHAWSEMAHGTLYKPKSVPGFGSRQQKGIRNRMTALMEKHLMPAGHDFQKIVSDARMLAKAQTLFESDPLAKIRSCTNNDDRCSLLSEFNEYILPFYDDLPAEAASIMECVLQAALAAIAKKEATATPSNRMETYLAGATLDRALQIVSYINMSVVDEGLITSTFDTLVTLYSLTDSNADHRKNIIDAVGELSKHQLRIWEKAGPLVQQILLEHIQNMKPCDRTAATPVALEALHQMLLPEITGSEWKFDAVTISTGSVLPSSSLRQLRADCLSLMIDMLDRATTDNERLNIIVSLHAASRIPHRGKIKPELLTIVLENAADVIRMLTERFSSFSFEVREKVEYDVLTISYHRLKLPNAYSTPVELLSSLEGLRNSIVEFRAAIKASQDYDEYYRYKTLVGFDVAFDSNWDGEPWDKTFRNAEMIRLAAEVNADNIESWLQTLQRCAETTSADGATFINLQAFLQEVGKRAPEIGPTILRSEHEGLARFLPWLMIGLEEHGPNSIAIEKLKNWIAQGDHLQSVACYLRFSKTERAELFVDAAMSAIRYEDDWALTLIATDPHLLASPDGIGRVLIPALRHLHGQGDFSWVHRLRFDALGTPISELFDDDQVRELLNFLVDAPEIQYDVEILVSALASRWPVETVDLFYRRLAKETALEGTDNVTYEALPYKFHQVPERAPNLASHALHLARQRFAIDAELFRFRSGLLVALLAPSVSSIEPELSAFISAGSEEDIEFVLAVLSSFSDDEASGSKLCRELAAVIDPLSEQATNLKIVIENAGVLSGEFGQVEALKAKRELMETWQDDIRPTVQRFAELYIAELDRDIAAEQRRATEQYQLRRRHYGEE